MYLYIYLLNGSQSSLALVDRNYSYINFVDIVITKFDLDPTNIAVSLKYVLNHDLPAFMIKKKMTRICYHRFC